MPYLRVCDNCSGNLNDFVGAQVSYGFGATLFDMEPDQYFCDERCLFLFLEKRKDEFLPKAS